MPDYDLSSIGALAAASELAHTRADQEPSQDSYNAAWLHGYASALADAAKQLETQQELIDAITGYISRQHDSAELYAVLHDTLTIDEALARRAKEMNSYFDYVEGNFQAIRELCSDQ